MGRSSSVEKKNAPPFRAKKYDGAKNKYIGGQLATFIEIMKEVPIIAVNTAKLEAIVKEELRYQ